MKTLFDAEVGKTYNILTINNLQNNAIFRLCELGFTNGQSVKVVARSMFRCATLVEIRGYLLSVRTSLLKSVVIQ